jgi:ABC-2 type transport system permease protein
MTGTMTAGTDTTTRKREDRAGEAAGYRVTPARVLRSEWCKLWTLRSTWYTLTATIILVMCLGPIIAAGYRDNGNGSSDAIDISLFGANIALLIIIVLGVLITASEYSTGMIRSSLAAVPRRLPLLWAKAAIYAGVVFVLAAGSVSVAFRLSQIGLADTRLAASLSDPGILRSLIGTAGELALLGVLSLALGSLTRNIAGGVAASVGGLLVVPQMINLLPVSWADDLAWYTPAGAGDAMGTLTRSAHQLSPLAGTAVLLVWTALALAAAGVLLVRRDA